MRQDLEDSLNQIFRQLAQSHAKLSNICWDVEDEDPVYGGLVVNARDLVERAIMCLKGHEPPD
jgi:hypothetical protein